MIPLRTNDFFDYLIAFPSLSIHSLKMHLVIILTTFSALTASVTAHGLFTEVRGANGVTGLGMGITDPSGEDTRLFNQVC